VSGQWEFTSAPTVPALTIGKAAASTSKDLIVFQTNETGAGDFRISIQSTLNGFGSTRYDQVLSWSYNQNIATGNRVILTEHAMAWSIENYFVPSGSAQTTESHLQYISRTGTVIRPIIFTIDLPTDSITTELTHDSFFLTQRGGVSTFLATTSEIRILGAATQFRHDTNNVPWFRQKNAAGNGYAPLVYLDNGDSLVLGSNTATPNMFWAGPGIFAFGGLFSGFPALKAIGAVLAVRNGTDAADATISALTFQTKTALVALGGGAAPTLGTIGGSGPTAAAQNTWCKMLDSAGAVFWVPAWK
jgi:hypothetical protein